MIAIEPQREKWSSRIASMECDDWLTPCKRVDAIHVVERLDWVEWVVVAASEDEPPGVPPSPEGERLAGLAASALRDWEAENEA